MPEPKKEEMKKEEMKKDLPMPKIGGGGGQVRAQPAPARITVSMPADARFTIDDYISPARSDTHIIVCSPLAANETKTYVLKAEGDARRAGYRKWRNASPSAAAKRKR